MKKTLLFVALFFLLINSASSQEGLLKVRIDDFSGGQASSSLANIIQPNQGELFKNVVLTKKGQLSKRGGQSQFCASHASVVYTGVGRYDPDVNTSYVIIASGTDVLRATSSDTNWTRINPSNDLTSGYDTEFLQANDLLFTLNGQDDAPSYNGSAWLPSLGWASSSAPTATTGAWLRNYLFLSGNSAQSDWVYFSNNLVPTTFDSTDVFKVNTGDGQPIKRIEAFRLNELIIYKSESVYVLDITGSTPLTDWTVQPISTSIGCVAPRSVVSLGNDQWFLSSEPIAIRSLIRSQYDKILIEMVSAPIQDIFDGTADTTINTSQASKACAVLYDNKFFLAIPTGSSTVNNYVVVYDFLTNGWSVIEGWYPAAWFVFSNELYYTDANSGRIVKCLTGVVGDFGTTIASQPTVEIAYEYISKEIDFDNPENYKSLDALEVEFDTTGSYNAVVYINLDNDGFQQVGTIDLSGDVVTLPVTLPFTLTSGGVARKTFQVQRYGEFKKMQVKVTQSGLSEEVKFQRCTIFARMRKWRRE